MGYNNGDVVTGIIGNVDITGKGYISAGNGCLRSYIKWVPNNLFSLNHKLTIMCWVYLTGYKDYDTIAGFDDGLDVSGGLSFGFQYGYLKLRMKTQNYGARQADANMSQLLLSTWYHVCATVHLDTNGYGVITYYLNGVHQGTFTETNSWNNNNTIPANSAFYVGKYGFLGTNNTASSYAMHRINYLRLFNQLLSASDILSYILIEPVMLSANVSSVMVGESFTITFITNLALPVSYTITGVTPANLGISMLTGSFTQPSQSITFSAVSGGGSIMTLTVSGGYTVSVNIIKFSSTTVYNPTETYRIYNTDSFLPSNSKMYSTYAVILNTGTGMIPESTPGVGEAFVYFDRSSTITGAYFQNRAPPNAPGQNINNAYFYYSNDPIPSTKNVANFQSLSYTRLNNTIGSSWTINTTTAPYATVSSNFDTDNVTRLGFRCEINFVTPVTATVFRFAYISNSSYSSVRFALKYMGDGLITQLIAPGNLNMTVPSSMNTIVSQKLYNATSKIEDVSCNSTYSFVGYNNGGVVTGISGDVNLVAGRRYIYAGNGCLRSYNMWVPNNLFTLNTKLTIMCWVYLTGYKDYDTIAGFDTGFFDLSGGLSFGMHNGYLKLRMNTSNYGLPGVQAADANMSRLSLSTWYHVCATVSLAANGYGVITYYVNGVYQETFTETNSWNNITTIPANAAFYVGKYGYLDKNNTVSSYAMNRINNLRLFNQQLSASDILSYYNSEI
jgi:hypothetical protein